MKRLTTYLWRDRTVLWLMVLVSGATHGGAFWLVGVTDRANGAGLSTRPRVQLVQPGLQRPAAAGSYLVGDLMPPHVLSLPSRVGFSARSWARDGGFVFRGFDPAIAPAFLEAPAPGPFESLLERRPLAEQLQTAATRARPDATTTVEPGSPALQRSVYRVSGALAERPVLQSPALPAVTNAVPLRPTGVRVGVVGDGTVRFAVLESGSGSETVDAQAMAWVRQLRFEPVAAPAPERLTWGLVRVLWWTQWPAPPESGAP